MKLTFPKTLLSLSIACAAALTAIYPATVSAAPPAQQKTQVPGYYRMMLGDFEVTALYDGYVDIDRKVLKGMDAKNVQTLLARMFLDSHATVQTAVNAYLVNTGSHLVLVDAGTAQCFGPTLGAIVGNIRAAGYKPEDIDTVLLTHLHADHACGINHEGQMAFPNATVHVAKAEADFWLSKEIAAKAPPESQAFFKMSQDSVAPYVAADKLKTYAPGSSLVPGIEVIPTPGHTPGHTAYLLKSKDQSLLLWGDIVHSHSIQFMHPEVAMEFDVDSKQAIATRKKIFADAAKNKLWVGGAHMPFPGLGHVRAESKGYAWAPVEYSPVRTDRKQD